MDPTGWTQIIATHFSCYAGCWPLDGGKTLYQPYAMYLTQSDWHVAHAMCCYPAGHSSKDKASLSQLWRVILTKLSTTAFANLGCGVNAAKADNMIRL